MTVREYEAITEIISLLKDIKNELKQVKEMVGKQDDSRESL